MNKTNFADNALLNVALDRQSPVPLFEQLVQILRGLILQRQLLPGSRLPSSRKFAQELSVSRVTIVAAFDQLAAEGYVEGRRGAGVFVAPGLPEEALLVGEIKVDEVPEPPVLKQVRPFQDTYPDMRLFPHKHWAKMFTQVWSNPEEGLLSVAETFGWWPLRREIARHLQSWRGVHCRPEQIIITSGASEAIQLIISALLKRGDVVVREEPGYQIFEQVLARNGFSCTTISVDKAGACVDELDGLVPEPRGVIVTPSRQFPLGMTMPLARRLQLLAWAENSGAFVVEDDFDSEYRYTGRPLPALASLAENGSVIYMGSFSKVFSKSLRLGFLVVPDAMIDRFRSVLGKSGSNAAFLAQPVLARFMADGEYAAHIRRMRRTYARRQKAFIMAADKYLSGLIDFSAAESGMHVVGWLGRELKEKISDVEICEQVAQRGLILRPLSLHYRDGGKQGVIAGFAGFDEREIEHAVCLLGKALSQCRKNN